MTKSEFKALVGKNLKKQRMKHGLSKDDLAVLLNLTPSFIGLIEQGERGLTSYNLFKLTHVFNMPAEDFMTGISSSPSSYSGDYESKCHRKLTILTKRLPQSKLEFLIAMVHALDEF